MECACRWFIVDDVDMLEDDLQLLKSLFEAEGEGLSKPQIEELCAPLAGLLVTMQLDTGILMSNFKQVGLPLIPANVAAGREGSQRHECNSTFTSERTEQALLPCSPDSPGHGTGLRYLSLGLHQWAKACRYLQLNEKLQGHIAVWEHAGDVQGQGSGPCH